MLQAETWTAALPLRLVFDAQKQQLCMQKHLLGQEGRKCVVGIWIELRPRRGPLRIFKPVYMNISDFSAARLPPALGEATRLPLFGTITRNFN